MRQYEMHRQRATFFSCFDPFSQRWHLEIKKRRQFFSTSCLRTQLQHYAHYDLSKNELLNEIKTIAFTHLCPLQSQLVRLCVHHPTIYLVTFFHVMTVRLSIVPFVHYSRRPNLSEAFAAIYHVHRQHLGLVTMMMESLHFHRISNSTETATQKKHEKKIIVTNLMPVDCSQIQIRNNNCAERNFFLRLQFSVVVLTAIWINRPRPPPAIPVFFGSLSSPFFAKPLSSDDFFVADNSRERRLPESWLLILNQQQKKSRNFSNKILFNSLQLQF